MPTNALPYHEPSIIQILILSSFLLFLNIINSLIDSYIYCGLIGQIFIGIAWGLPAAAWLSIPIQETITQLGYLGLILMVFEGGLSTSLTALRSNLFLSIGVALTGIWLPMALSFSLMGFADTTALQAFAAGAALCSTSLGTTFSLLSSSGLVTSRLGVVLSSAAMLDDVVGLVMIQIISNLGNSSTLSAVTVVRPVMVSLAFATILPALCVIFVKPILHSSFGRRSLEIPNWARPAVTSRSIAFLLQISILIAFVTAASYAGTSNLFSAYLAGVFISWAYAQFDSDTERSHERGECETSPSLDTPPSSQNASNEHQDHIPAPTTSGTEIYAYYLSPTVDRVLKPFFFASIGFSIPITSMFTWPVIRRSLIYTPLMLIGKLACGIWVFQFPPSSFSRQVHRLKFKPSATSTDNAPKENKTKNGNDNENENEEPSQPPQPSSSTSNPHPIIPASILGFAMVARGEIGFLIAALAESAGIFNAAAARGTDDDHENRGSNQDSELSESSESSELFLVVSWAILLCTVIGPVCVGFCVRRSRDREIVF